MKILCAFGRYQYGASYRGTSTEYAAFLPAFKNLGHKVLFFELWDKSDYTNYADLNCKLIDILVQEKPDVMFTVPMHYEIWLETLNLIKTYINTITICWTTDDSWKYREVSKFIGSAYDIITTTYNDVLPLYNRDGIQNVYLTQWAANSQTLHPPLKASECTYPVSFVGAAHGNRKQRIKALMQKGIQVACFGHGWPSGSVPASDISNIMRQSVISLNFANSKGANQIKARTFEVPGAGGFLLTESAPRLDRFYCIGKEIDTFNDIDELAEKIQFYLNRPSVRDSMAEAAFARTRAEHTYEHRLQALLEDAYTARTNIKHTNQLPRSYETIVRSHQLTTPLKMLRKILLTLCSFIWGDIRGPRAARRLIFELSWRIMGEKTFRAAGWPGRMFPKI
ncbi:MAG: glycosyltransferase [Proteobacteria bacterium]|nr:glycosyltransferase [Pseudomonadota bacterium]MBU4258706.1 glycosyltransferase [Pseudomonadota bacterium]MBU4288625.1 glycosyltransferase [Pseudomonadota bacterium]